MDAALHKYWLAGRLPILADITVVIQMKLAGIFVDQCECDGAQKYIDNAAYKRNDEVLQYLHSRQWCLFCMRSTLISPANARFWTRAFVYKYRWDNIDDRCTCKYVSSITKGYDSCYEMRQYGYSINGYCRYCDTAKIEYYGCNDEQDNTWQ